MSLYIEELKRKIKYRSNYRGTKEMDILLSTFIKTIIDDLNKNDLENLLTFLNIDDENLYKFKQGFEINTYIENNKISKLFKDFNHKK
tara:strand:- start:673 stop:936 length:264 start_codon:yes stop_codon:yes gene_type:complete